MGRKPLSWWFMRLEMEGRGRGQDAATRMYALANLFVPKSLEAIQDSDDGSK